MSVAVQFNSEDDQPIRTAFTLFPTTPRVPENDVYALITDFFKWLEADWRLPTFPQETTLPALPQPLALNEEVYTAKEIALLYGYNSEHVGRLLLAQSISPLAGGKGGISAVYRKRDLVSIIKQWEWVRILSTLNHWWLRFYPPACEACSNCKRRDLAPLGRQLNCTRSVTLSSLRSVAMNFLEEVYFLGGVAARWRKLGAPAWSKKRQSSGWGIILIYLLDRRLLHLSDDELLQLKPVCNRNRYDLTRLWRNRHPDEYEQFQNAVKAANIRDGETKSRAEMILCLLVLLKYGLSSLVELGCPLSPEEIQQACSEGLLVTHHLGYGIYLPYPLIADIRIGHVVLDSIRRYFWQYAADMKRKGERNRWSRGPHQWQPMDLSVIEQALAAPKYEGGEGILSRRPETEHALHNPWLVRYKRELAGNAYEFLPLAVQEHIMAYLMYCLQQLQLEVTTVKARLEALMHFFTWVGTQGKLASYPHWTRQYAEDIFRAYIAIGCAGLNASSQNAHCKKLSHFFSILADLGYPIPEGFRILYTLSKDDGPPRSVPREEILDRVFREGLCNLNYDPFSRLALTIQYYCGTRITETLDMHLICVLENAQGAFMLIPKGKSKQERTFPIVKLGMGTLFAYMDEVFYLRTSDGKTSRTLGKTNLRYLNDDPERAMDWQYLFDRVPSPDGRVKKRGRLSKSRVEQAFREALLIAARINPDGLFQPGTHHSDCRRQRQKGQYCNYFAAQEGITTCPCCGSPLSGKRGAWCRHILEEDFKCDGVARQEEVFCPKCDAPLATFLPVSTHVFRHNSVSRAHRAGVSLAQNMKLHGHQTIPMHLRYLHLFLEDAVDEVERVFAEKRLREVLRILGTASGQIVEGGIAHSVSLEGYLAITLQRLLRRRTLGIWGGFWAGALAQQGVASPIPTGKDIVILEDTYEYAAAQYWYEALGLAVSEVAFERVTQGKWRAEVPLFLDRQKIEDLVQFNLRTVQDSLGTTLGRKLMEADIGDQRQFLDKLAEMLHPWWKHQPSIDALIEMFAPGGGHAFQKQLPPAESES